MFEKYAFKWIDDEGFIKKLEFFIHVKKTRGGYTHRACIRGCVPRLDDKGTDLDKYRGNTDKLRAKSVARRPYRNHEWEWYTGQKCLAKLWKQISDLPFVCMAQISTTNPFEGKDRPNFEDIIEPDELFGRFKEKMI